MYNEALCRSESAERGAGSSKRDPASKRPPPASLTAGNLPCRHRQLEIKLPASRSRSLAPPPSRKLPSSHRDSSGICATDCPDTRQKEKGLILNRFEVGTKVGKLLFQGLRISCCCVTVNLFVFVTALPLLCSARILIQRKANSACRPGRPPASLSSRRQLGEQHPLVSLRVRSHTRLSSVTDQLDNVPTYLSTGKQPANATQNGARPLSHHHSPPAPFPPPPALVPCLAIKQPYTNV